jgi:hypothetical protein
MQFKELQMPIYINKIKTLRRYYILNKKKPRVSMLYIERKLRGSLNLYFHLMGILVVLLIILWLKKIFSKNLPKKVLTLFKVFNHKSIFGVLVLILTKIRFLLYKTLRDLFLQWLKQYMIKLESNYQNGWFK